MISNSDYEIVEKAIVKMAQYTTLIEELIALSSGIDDDWWFAEDLDDHDDLVGLKLKRILQKYEADTSDIEDELEL